MTDPLYHLTAEHREGLILNHRHRSLKVILLDNGEECLVHAPDHVGGVLRLAGKTVLLEPIAGDRLCKYRVIALESEGEWTGANPSFSERVVLDTLLRGLVPGWRLLKRGHRVEGSLLDAQCQIDHEARAVEIKGVNVYGPGFYLFPSKTVDDYLEKLSEESYYKEPISTRAIRQGALLIKHHGHVVYAILGSPSRSHYPLYLNERDRFYYELYHEIPALVLRYEWSPVGLRYLGHEYLRGTPSTK